MHRFHDEALEEYVDSIRFYARANRLVGERFVQAIERAIDEIIEAPLRWRSVRGGLRRRVIRGFPYVIFYRVHEGYVFVLAVANCSRRPGYWRSRLS
jgi:plasmid stabilization system protein ParE